MSKVASKLNRISWQLLFAQSFLVNPVRRTASGGALRSNKNNNGTIRDLPKTTKIGVDLFSFHLEISKTIYSNATHRKKVSGEKPGK